MRKYFYMFRRFFLRNLIPEFFWPEAVLIDGVLVKLRNQPYSFGIKWLLSKNHEKYELAERSFIRELDEGDHVLEFGGSIGIVTALISKAIGGSGRIVSVEASEELVRHSRTWLEQLGNVEVVSAFAFPVMGRVNMRTAFDGDGGSLGGMVSFVETESEVCDNSHFFLQDADTFSNFQANVLFIDIEGSEQIMLEHKPNFPLIVKKIVIELHPGIYGEEIERQICEAIVAEGFYLDRKSATVYQFLR